MLVLCGPQQVFNLMGGAAGCRKSDGRPDADDAVHAAIGFAHGRCGTRRVGTELWNQRVSAVDPALQFRHEPAAYLRA